MNPKPEESPLVDPMTPPPLPVSPRSRKKLKAYFTPTVGMIGCGAAVASVIALGTLAGVNGSMANMNLAAYNASQQEVDELTAELTSTARELAGSEEDVAKFKPAFDMLADVEKREAELTAAEEAIDAREAAVTVVEETIERNSFADGGYIVGVSIEPGRYRTTTATSSCYWGVYASGTNKDDIVANDFGTAGTAEVTLSIGQDFESDSCGEWTKVG
ncbi:hypothetical protein [Microbacterium sp. CFBP9034]|uniref:hypothetical protein n=1 Tax=Microbacterium sp. CFBP9034 TaxID=3096540 RepID=UPI002A6AB15D|nr:hypothetical protein [Microbacterium sp. CFBP9034]MDY0910894.1 hypothetical protein [Microbacterium sp. CFBP9034]